MQKRVCEYCKEIYSSKEVLNPGCLESLVLCTTTSTKKIMGGGKIMLSSTIKAQQPLMSNMGDNS